MKAAYRAGHDWTSRYESERDQIQRSPNSISIHVAREQGIELDIDRYSRERIAHLQNPNVVPAPKPWDIEADRRKLKALSEGPSSGKTSRFKIEDTPA